MSTQNQNNESINLLTPNIGSINLSLGGGSSSKESLMSEDELNNLIISQQNPQQIQEIQQPKLPQQPSPVPPIPQQPQSPEILKDEQKIIHTILQEAHPTDEINSDGQNDDEPEEEVRPEDKFDLNTMNVNLNEIASSAKERIKALDDKQKVIDSRIKLIEKFILLDERDLAAEVVAKNPNMSRVGSLQKSILHRTELLSQILDISLKYEDTIIKWNKSISDIEKDKVSAFQKIKSLTKEIIKTDGDINDVLGKINTFVKENPDIINDAKNHLSISGYGGKPFNS